MKVNVRTSNSTYDTLCACAVPKFCGNEPVIRSVHCNSQVHVRLARGHAYSL
jgi:hypothetical protein